MTIAERVRECAEALLDSGNGRPSPEHITEEVFARYSTEVEEELAHQGRQHVRRIVRDVVKRMGLEDADESQMSFFGLPSIINVVSGDGSYVVRAERAVWDEVSAGQQQRIDNVAAAQAKLDAYRGAMAELRPYMETDQQVTVAQALRLRAGAS